MRRSLFNKYFTLTVSIIIVSFTILGAVLMTLVKNFWVDEKRDNLLSGARQASEIVEDFSRQSLISKNYIAQTISLLANVLESDIYVVYNDGEHYICSQEYLSTSGVCSHKGSISQRIVDKAVSGYYSEIGTMDGLYEKSQYTVGVPLMNRPFSQEPYGAVFVSSPSGKITEFVMNVFRMFMLAAMMVIIVAFFAVYAITRRMILPLRQMSDAAGAMAQGDFSRRINVIRDDEIGELAATFNEMTESLSSLEQMRRSFIGNVSHELKTPMTTIAGFIDGVLDGTIVPEKQTEYLKIVSDEIKRLSRLVTSMLSLSKLEAGEMTLNLVHCKLSDILLRTMLSLEQRIEERNITVEGFDGIHSGAVVADQDLIHQVLYNLIDNAVKFTPRDGKITINIAEPPGEAVITIRNTGKGVSPLELSHIFERFYKTDKSRGMDKSGAGLGLYIVRSIVNIHGGTIVAKSVLDEYTEFEVRLPAPKHPKQRE